MRRLRSPRLHSALQAYLRASPYFPHARLLAKFAAFDVQTASSTNCTSIQCSALPAIACGTMASADFCRFNAPFLVRLSSLTYRQISPGKNVNFLRMSPPHLRLHPLVVSDFVSFGKLVRMQTPYAIRVPRRTDLPPASFRFHLAVDTVAFG